MCQTAAVASVAAVFAAQLLSSCSRRARLLCRRGSSCAGDASNCCAGTCAHLDGLHRVDDDRDGARVERLERLLRVDVDAREPAAKAGVAVVPAHDHLGPGGERSMRG